MSAVIMGIDPTRVTSTSEFGLGQRGGINSSEGYKEYIYVKADGTGITADGYVCDFDASTFIASMSTTTTTAPGTGAGKPVGVARAAFTASYFGWLQIYGSGIVQVGASCAAYTRLNSTATAGQIDDDATASSEIIDTIVLDVARGGTAGTAAGWIQYPKVANTL